MKKILLALIFATGFVFTASAQDMMDDSGGGANSTDIAIYANGGIGYGSAIYGIGVGDNAETSDFYSGNGMGVHLGGMLTWKYLALLGSWQYAGAQDLEDKDGNPSGIDKFNYNVLDLSLGLILAREPGDMGYTLLYGGFRYWGAKIESSFNYDEVGTGWSAGIRDLSTFSFGSAALALQFGLILDSAPIKKINGHDTSLDFKSFGIGFEAGLGVALEDMGLLVMFLYRMDVVASVEDESASGSWRAAGVGNYNLSVTYQFDI
ncbi:MAG: hypothetical protein CVV44_09665 [Spirochaetae bacterium HGW-Spirochaetae-1]|jgi:hypothetical protein|nr:MAG: hypothetical protein CVV44_09665 [Spirochaetae bacterium HGW-Spirochaetae-1]